MRVTFLLGCFILLSLFTKAQKAIIAGVVMDNQKLSLPGATVKLSPGNRYTVSDVYGRFEFLNLPESNAYTLEVSYIGYETKQESIYLKSRETQSIQIVLVEKGILDKILVRGDRMKGQAKALNQQKNNPNISNIVSADQVGRFPDDNIGFM